MALLIVSCSLTKRVPPDKKLLMTSTIMVDDKKNSDEETYYQLYQKPNSSILGWRLRLGLYNLAKPKKDSLYHVWLDKNPNTHKTLTALLSEKQVNRLGKSFVVSGIGNLLRTVGEPPVLLDTNSTKKSLLRLKSYYFNKGYFDVKGSYAIDTIMPKKAALSYKLILGQPYKIDTIQHKIETPALDSLYQIKKSESLIKSNKQYNTQDFESERNRITTHFRNNGAFLFQANYISYDIDTIGNGKKANVTTLIKNYMYRENDTAKTAPFKLYKINKVNIFTDLTSNKAEISVIKDSAAYKGFNLYAQNKLKYRPKTIVNAVFIAPNSIYSDENTSLTIRYLNSLRIFNYPTVVYKQDPNDQNGLIAGIYLVPRKKYTFNASVDFTHSNIQEFGISGNSSVGIRNVFNGAESFEIGIRGNIGSSKQVANINERFFNITEIGADAKLNFPRIFFPINTTKIIPKSMIPSTSITAGFARQQNIGLDKQNFTSAFTYNWKPTQRSTARIDIVNIQFVKNLNTSNYFNIYKSSYETLNILAQSYLGNTNPVYFNEGNLQIESGVNNFIADASNNIIAVSSRDLKTISSIEERRKRLTENNLIFASNYSFSKTTQKDNLDNSFYAYKFKIESAGNFLSALARVSKQLNTQGGANTFFEVEYSQYLKGEIEFIKRWDLLGKKIIAMRAFAGWAAPYGNSRSIPFSRSYFGGGSNDNRAWQPYSLGPGSSASLYDFNEANMKLALNTELRFPVFGKFNGAVFADMGNIWNYLDAVEDEDFKFKGIKSLQEVAVGTGLGMRYDQGLFVVRLDLGFKTYNPALEENKRWFKELNFSKAVLNIGINYPF